jgi:hypothetical protein
MKARWIALVLVVAVTGCAEDMRGDAFTVSPVPDSETSVAPESAPDDAACHGEWCWLHPIPFAHSILELEQTGSKFHGVARLDETRGFDPFVWDTRIQMVETPGDRSYADMSPSKTGWLAITGESDVYAFGEDQETRTFRLIGVGYRKVMGTSAENFTAFSMRGDATVRRNGEFHAIRPVDFNEKVEYWSDDRAWLLTDRSPSKPDGLDFMEEINFPNSGRDDYPSLAVGPDPNSTCGQTQGVWASNDSNLLSKYDPDSGPKWDRNYDIEVAYRDFECVDGSHTWAVDASGGLSELRQGTWERIDLDHRALTSIEEAGDTTYIAGEHGAAYELTDAEAEAISGGFKLRSAFATPEGPQLYGDLWVNRSETRAVLTTDAGMFYRRGSDEWARMPTPELGDQTFRAGGAQVWGVEKPRFAIVRNQLLRWTGSEWVFTGLGPFEEHQTKLVDVSGNIEDGLWVLGNQKIFHFDGRTWETLTFGDNLIPRPEVDGLTFSALLVESEGTVLVSTKNNIHELYQERGQWILDRVRTSPCTSPWELYRAESGELYVGGERLCAAHRGPDGWTTYSDRIVYPNPPGHSPKEDLAFVPQPDMNRPALVTNPGILHLQDDETLKHHFEGRTIDAEYLPKSDVTLLLHASGILIRHH